LALLTKNGFKTDEAVTALKGGISELMAPSKEAKEHMDRLGISWKGLIPTLQTIADKRIPAEMFFRALVPDIRAANGLAPSRRFPVWTHFLQWKEDIRPAVPSLTAPCPRT
jgi:hypothetical protein